MCMYISISLALSLSVYKNPQPLREGAGAAARDPELWELAARG